jgi:antitoxin component of MazEF toxin-antitoxin module
MQVAKWGNSLAVRLPASVVDALELKEGDEIEIHVADEREFGVSRKPGREELINAFLPGPAAKEDPFRLLFIGDIPRVAS